MKLNHSQYLLYNEFSDEAQVYMDASFLVASLSHRKSRSHLKILVIGTKSTSMPIGADGDLISLQKILVTEMRSRS